MMEGSTVIRSARFSAASSRLKRCRLSSSLPSPDNCALERISGRRGRFSFQVLRPRELLRRVADVLRQRAEQVQAANADRNKTIHGSPTLIAGILAWRSPDDPALLAYLFSVSAAGIAGFRGCWLTVLSSTGSRIELGLESPQNPQTGMSAPRRGTGTWQSVQTPASAGGGGL